jgi:hypothetical protein
MRGLGDVGDELHVRHGVDNGISRYTLTMHVDDLVSFWSRLDLQKPPFAHPDDLPVLRSTKKGRLIDEDPKKTYREFVEGARFGDSRDRRLELSLLPVPYAGDLKKADIIILTGRQSRLDRRK